MNKKYNGYTNYPTWRVNADIIGEIDFTECDYEITADYLQEIVEEIVLHTGVHIERGLAFDYARSFLAEVNYFELAKLINEELEHENR